MARDNAPAQTWIDIPPPEVTAATLDVPMLIAAAAVILLALFFIYYRRRPRQRAKNTLRRLRLAQRQSFADYKAACFQIGACLRSGFGVTHLDRVFFEGASQADWHAFLSRLAHSSYTAKTPTPAELASLIHEAGNWLNRRSARR